VTVTKTPWYSLQATVPRPSAKKNGGVKCLHPIIFTALHEFYSVVLKYGFRINENSGTISLIYAQNDKKYTRNIYAKTYV